MTGSRRSGSAAPSLNDDPRLSRYVVVETGPEGEPRLRHTLTGRVLPADACGETLGRELFLAGQEQAALERRLEPDLSQLALTLIVTWECNLRCSHCSVLDRLVRNQPERLDTTRLARFLDRFRRARPELSRLRLTLLGGEPLLRPVLCREAVEAVRATGLPSHCDVTTNLAMELAGDHLDLLGALDAIVVSLDGLQPAHDAQRRPYRDRFGPFERTTGNLARLVEAGLADKLYVQGAIRDEFATLEHFKEFQRALMAIGVRWDRISFETVHPSPRRRRVERTYLDSLRQPVPRRLMCCKYRGGRSLVIGPDGRVHSDFYDFEPVGDLDDPPEALLGRFRALVRTMPALADPACRACPVIGFCWGGCTSARPVAGDRPSALCGQEALIERVRRLASEGRLLAPAGGMPAGCA